MGTESDGDGTDSPGADTAGAEVGDNDDSIEDADADADVDDDEGVSAETDEIVNDAVVAAPSPLTS